MQVKIEIDKIKKMEKCKVMQWFDTGIKMVMDGPDAESFTFSGFEDRNEAFESLESIW